MHHNLRVRLKCMNKSRLIEIQSMGKNKTKAGMWVSSICNGPYLSIGLRNKWVVFVPACVCTA